MQVPDGRHDPARCISTTFSPGPRGSGIVGWYPGIRPQAPGLSAAFPRRCAAEIKPAHATTFHLKRRTDNGWSDLEQCLVALERGLLLALGHAYRLPDPQHCHPPRNICFT